MKGILAFILSDCWYGFTGDNGPVDDSSSRLEFVSVGIHLAEELVDRILKLSSWRARDRPLNFEAYNY